MKILLVLLLIGLCSAFDPPDRRDDGADLQHSLSGSQTSGGKTFNIPTLGGGKPLIPNFPGIKPGIKPLKPLQPLQPFQPFGPFKPITPIKRIKPIAPIAPITPIKPITSIKAAGGKDDGKSEIQKKLRGVTKLEDVLKLFPTKGLEITSAGKGLVGKGDKTNVLHMWVKKEKCEKGGACQKSTGRGNMMTFATQGECKPVVTCHDMRHLSHTHNGEIWPSSISYLKCGGCCLDHQKPVPVEFEKPTKVNIVVIPYDQPSVALKEFYYTEHKRCACVCKIKPEDCKSTQTYDSEHCRCTCDASAKKICPPSKQWSNTDCDCVCKYPDTVCTGSKHFDTNECECKCKKQQECKSFMKWNKYTCSCIHSFG